jgi:hypothetical protein
MPLGPLWWGGGCRFASPGGGAAPRQCPRGSSWPPEPSPPFLHSKKRDKIKGKCHEISASKEHDRMIAHLYQLGMGGGGIRGSVAKADPDPGFW